MKFLLPMLFLITGCQDFFYPADEYLEVPGGYEIRFHCLPECPSHDRVREALALVADQMGPHISFNPYQQWSYYGITFRNAPFYYADQQLLGVTLHNTGAVAIWMPYECPPNPSGVCPGVLGWEMKLVLTERMLRKSTESQKIEWLSDRGVENTTWEIQ